MVLGVSDLLGTLIDKGAKELLTANTDNTMPTPAADQQSPMSQSPTSLPQDAAGAPTQPISQGADIGGNFDTDPRHVSLYRAYRELGQSDFAAKALVAEVGRENAFQDKYLFGDHSDPANARTNAGIFSWQKGRRDQLVNTLAEQGYYKNGQIEKSYESLKAQAKFSLDELNSAGYGGGKITNYLNSKDADPETAFRMLGKDYIKWRYDDPKYASGHQNRDSWYNKISDAAAKLAPIGKYIMENQKPNNVKHQDYNFSEQGLEDAMKINKLASRDVGMTEKLGMYYDSSKLASDHGKRELAIDNKESMIDRISRESGVPYNKSTGSYVQDAFAKQLNNLRSFRIEDAEGFNDYIARVKKENPSYNLPVSNYSDVLLQTGDEIRKKDYELAEATKDDGFVNRMSYGLLAGAAAIPTDPLNTLATVATAPLAGATVVSNALIQGGVNAAIEGLQAGIEMTSDTRSKMGLPDATLGESAMRVGMGFGAGAVLGGGLKAIGDGLSKYVGKADHAAKMELPEVADPLGDAPVPVDYANTAIAADTAAQIYTSPFENSELGKELLEAGINKAARDVDAGLPVAVVPENTPPVKMSYKERTGVDPEVLAYQSSDLNYSRNLNKVHLDNTVDSFLPENTITSQEYTATLRNMDPNLVSTEQGLAKGNTLADSVIRDKNMADEALAASRPVDKAPVAKFMEDRTALKAALKESRAMEAIKKSGKVTATEMLNEDLVLPPEVDTAAPPPPPKYSAEVMERVTTLNSRLSRVDEVSHLDASRKQSSTFKKAELAAELKEAQAQFKNDPSISKERKADVLESINEDLSIESKTYSWANERLKRSEALRSKITSELKNIEAKAKEADALVPKEPAAPVVADSATAPEGVVDPKGAAVKAPERGSNTFSAKEPVISTEAKPLLDSLHKNLDALNKQLDELEGTEQKDFLYTNDVGDEIPMNKLEFQEHIESEKTAVEMVINCVLNR